jgi:hypothetical protein
VSPLDGDGAPNRTVEQPGSTAGSRRPMTFPMSWLSRSGEIPSVSTPRR